MHNDCLGSDLIENGGKQLDDNTIVGAYGNVFAKNADGSYTKVGKATPEQITRSGVVVRDAYTRAPSIDDIELPDGYSKNADGSISGPGTGIAYLTEYLDESGRVVFRRQSGSYYVIGADGNQVSVPSPYRANTPEIHHICTNKNCKDSSNGGSWTPRYEELFNNAGLNLDDEINKVVVPGHSGRHPGAYHLYVYRELSKRLDSVTPHTPEYTEGMVEILNRLKVEALTPGHQVNVWLTGG